MLTPSCLKLTRWLSYWWRIHCQEIKIIIKIADNCYRKRTRGFFLVLSFHIISPLSVFRHCTKPFQTDTVTMQLEFIKKHIHVPLTSIPTLLWLKVISHRYMHLIKKNSSPFIVPIFGLRFLPSWSQLNLSCVIFCLFKF